MTFLPGKKADGIFGRHDRTLATDAQALRDEWGIDLLVLLVEDHELLDRLAAGDEEDAYPPDGRIGQ